MCISKLVSGQKFSSTAIISILCGVMQAALAAFTLVLYTKHQTESTCRLSRWLLIYGISLSGTFVPLMLCPIVLIYCSNPKLVGFALCLFCPVLLLGVFSCAWLIVGSVWVYHTDPGCTESLYEAGQYIVIASWVLLALNCILQCCARLITIRI